MRILAVFIVCAIVTAMSVPALASARTPAKTWEFEVLLDGTPIGSHRFALTDRDGGYQLDSEARFDVRFLFFNAFRYRHSNTEVWSDGCLQSIRSTTDTNGEAQSVSGLSVDDRLVIRADDDEQAIDGCVMSFAYWNPEFLEQPRLLNPQTGEYLPVKVERIDVKALPAKSGREAAEAWRLRAGQIELTVWYSKEREWLGLESVANGGRILRYELIG